MQKEEKRPIIRFWTEKKTYINFLNFRVTYTQPPRLYCTQRRSMLKHCKHFDNLLVDWTWESSDPFP